MRDDDNALKITRFGGLIKLIHTRVPGIASRNVIAEFFFPVRSKQNMTPPAPLTFHYLINNDVCKYHLRHRLRMNIIAKRVIVRGAKSFNEKCKAWSANSKRSARDR